MAIFRGDGGAGDSNTDATLSLVTEQAVIATTKASDAATSATSASDSAVTAATQASASATSATNAAASAEGVEQYAIAAANSATASANSATTSATSATAAGTAETNAETAETNAEAAESNASTSAATATTKASEAVTSASSASTSASTAATKASEASTSASNASTSESNAATSASGASTSATNASNSATAAGSSASGASTSATNASNSASAASTSETNAGNSATAASGSASTASTAATSAGDSATAASGSASTASTQASAAATSATNASTSETNASTSATNAATSETNAETAETNAETAEANAETAETNAAASATTATTKASEASTSATSAATSETNASNSASAASTSAATATTKASEASTSATNAATSASTATTQASNASTSASSSSDSATSAGTAQTAAEAARDAALAAFDSFDDRYLGQKATAPTTDNDGNPLVTGTLYFNTTSSEMKVWDGSAWLNAYASLSGALLQTNNLSDLNNAGTSRTNLGLGTAATTASTAYATAAQGTKVDGIEANADVTDTANVVASLSAGTGIGLSAGGAISNTAPDQTVALTGAGTTSVSGTYPNFTITGTGATYTAGSGLSLTGTVFANTAPDRTVSLTGSGATSISGTYPNFTISSVNTTYSVGDGGLSQINFTSADHTKLNGIATGATNVTNNNQLTNGRGFVTSSGNTVIGTDSDINTSGATVVDQLNMTDGVIQSHSTRTMTLANLGYTGATNANNYSFPYTVNVSASNSTIVQRDGNGYMFGNYFNGTGTFATSGASSGMGRFTGTNGSDTYGRSYTAAAARALLNVENGATADQSSAEIRSAMQNASPTFGNVYTYGWYRNNDINEGMYNEATGAHFYSSAANVWNIGGGGLSQYFRMRNNHQSTVLGTMYADTSYKHGFLNTADGWKFFADNSNNFYCYGNITAYYSDTRLKDEQTQLTSGSGLALINQLKVKSFVWNALTEENPSIETGATEIGLIAQELELLIPNAVVINEASNPSSAQMEKAKEEGLPVPETPDYKTINYDKLIPFLIQAVQDLKAEIETLKRDA